MSITINVPAESKAWVFQSPRELTKEECSLIDQEMKNFISSWESHGSPLKGYYEVIANRFILLTVDESAQMATGCSIDKSVAVLQKIEQALSLNLTDKGMIVYENESGEIKSAHFSQVKELVTSGEIKPETTFYDASVATFGEFLERWKIQAKDSWLSRYF